MIRVQLLCEDRTGTGLARVLRAAAYAKRDPGLPPLRFPSKPGTCHGNFQLLESCRKYERLRFNHRPRFDHVFYVIDAYPLWNLRPHVDIEAPSPGGDLDAYLDRLRAAACDAMTARARGSDPDESWAEKADGFHPHVLVWERESLILPVSDALGLGEPPDEPVAVRTPASWVTRRMTELRGEKYDKAVDGPSFLERIAQSPELLERVLASTPSLAAIVDELAAL